VIIPVQDGDGIGGSAKASPTFDEFRSAVGIVRSIKDGKCIVVVKELSAKVTALENA
jgi:hypothetical protein